LKRLFQNWQWDGHIDVPRPRTREAAFLSVKAGDDSTIRYLMPMVADARGYHPHLKFHLNGVTVSSSLNDIRLLTAKSCEVRRLSAAASVTHADVSSGFGRDALPAEMGCCPSVDVHNLA
jgi:hypothetical protein